MTIRQRVTTGDPAAASHEMMQYWTDVKVVTDDARMRTIADVNAHTLAIVNKAGKRYSVMTFDEVRRRAEAAQKYLPAEAREVMTASSRIVLKPTGKTETITGRAAKEYTIEGTALSGTVWATTAIQLPAAARDPGKLSELMGGAHNPGTQLAQALAELNAFPLRTTMTTGIGTQMVTMHTEVIELTEQTPPAAVLSVPAGFTRVEPETFGPPAQP